MKRQRKREKGLGEKERKRKERRIEKEIKDTIITVVNGCAYGFRCTTSERESENQIFASR